MGPCHRVNHSGYRPPMDMPGITHPRQPEAPCSTVGTVMQHMMLQHSGHSDAAHDDSPWRTFQQVSSLEHTHTLLLFFVDKHDVLKR